MGAGLEGPFLLLASCAGRLQLHPSWGFLLLQKLLVVGGLFFRGLPGKKRKKLSLCPLCPEQGHGGGAFGGLTCGVSWGSHRGTPS